MSRFPSFDFTLEEVRQAGEIISGDLKWTPETETAIRQAFSIANQWRDSHSFPMRSMRGSLRAHIRLKNLNGFSAARLKRMNAIRGKLKRMSGRKRPLGLDQLQDLGGCRAVMDSIEDVERLVAIIKERFRHKLWAEDDYIHHPKKDGYRCHHLKYEFVGKGDSVVHNGRRIELQIRTAFQHSWATAVEAVGLFRGEALKAGQGSPEWRRLFQLMSAEFAEAEGCDPPAGLPVQHVRMRELKELDKELGALQTLENITNAVRWVEDAITAPDFRPAYYLIRYDHKSREVQITPYSQLHAAFQGYETAESFDNVSGIDTADVVLVEADKIESLPDAYPNYFGDVYVFRDQLASIIKGQPISDYKIALQARARVQRRERIDPSWIGRRGLWSEPKRRR